LKSGIILSVRDKSSRFPGKVLKKVLHQTVTEHLIDRIKMAEGWDRVIIGTSDDPRDRVFESIADGKQVDIYYGDQDDKLLRYHQICREFDLQFAVIVDGDDILCFPEVMTRTILTLRQNDNDAVFWNDLPLGAASNGLKSEALEKVLEMKAENDTEVWGGYFRDNDAFRVSLLTYPDPLFNHPEIRLTMDYDEDFRLIETIFTRLYPQNPGFSSRELLELLVNREPELTDINKSAVEKYSMHIAGARPVRFRKDRS
jgi:spore coat polysaccharide biosynthesis protein SpsF